MCGPFAVMRVGGAKYIIALIYEYSCYAVVRFSQNKECSAVAMLLVEMISVTNIVLDIIQYLITIERFIVIPSLEL
jgi:hypothetical protein